MKRFILTLCLGAMVPVAYGQGTVKFANTSSILISWNNPAGGGAIPANAGTIETTFYFAILSAPQGTLNPLAFTFAGAYATNTSTPGRLQGGNLLSGEPMNSTWLPAQTRQFEVFGWSADGGPAFNPAWFTVPSSRNFSYAGLSTIGLAAAGGVDPITGLTLQPFAAFSGSTIPNGFILTAPWPFPEPSSTALGILAVACLGWRRFKARNE